MYIVVQKENVGLFLLSQWWPNNTTISLNHLGTVEVNQLFSEHQKNAILARANLNNHTLLVNFSWC